MEEKGMRRGGKRETARGTRTGATVEAKQGTRAGAKEATEEDMHGEAVEKDTDSSGEEAAKDMERLRGNGRDNGVREADCTNLTNRGSTLTATSTSQRNGAKATPESGTIMPCSWKRSR